MYVHMYVLTYALMYTHVFFLYIRMHVCIYTLMCFFLQLEFATASKILNPEPPEAIIYSDSLKKFMIALHRSLTGLDLNRKGCLFTLLCQICTN
jgi:hypothetical protein